ncbi:MAG: slipin family protein [Candidatus Paceibacterota bacterium]|jgi:regulator of protease activity HflC (stomatin/prohibitin superfamily)
MNNDQRQTSSIGNLILGVFFLVFVSIFLSNTIGSLGVGMIVLIVVFLFAIAGIRIVDQYEKGIVLTFGKFTSTRGPGLNWIFPAVQVLIKVDTRVDTVDIPQQEVITKDNVTVGINAVVYFKVDSAEKAVLEVQNYTRAVALYAQATLRDVIGGVELDVLLSERDKIAEEIKKIVDVATDPWGIDVSNIKIQDIELPADMKRVMAKQAESERERRATIIRSEGELAASEKLSQAAEKLSSVPGGMSMRTLATIEKINPDPSKTVIFALPIEFMEGIKTLGEYFKTKK